MLSQVPGGFPHLLAQAAVAALLSGAAAVERKGFAQLMLSRPLVLAPLLGWALGDVAGGLMLGVPLELLFLGGVNLGGSVPENETLLAGALTAAVIPAGALRGGVDPALATLGLALLYPLAMLGRWLERATEQRNSALARAAAARIAGGDPEAVRLNLRGLFMPFLATAAIAAACALASPAFAALRGACGERLALALEGGWHAVWALSAAVAIRAIRDNRAPLLAGASALAVGLAAIMLRVFE